MYLIRLALRPWRVAPWSQALSMVAVGFLLVLAGFLFWLEAGLKPIVARLSREEVITAYLDPSVDSKSEAKVVDAIRVAAGARPAEVRLVGADRFAEELKGAYPDLARELEGLGPEANSIIPRYVTAAGVFNDGALEKIKKVAGVESAETSRDRHAQVAGAFKALRWVARVLAFGLCLALFVGLVQLTRMNAHLHRDSMSLLRLWGAGPITLRTPVLLSGLWVGLWGGAIALGLWATGTYWLSAQIRLLSPMLTDLPLPSGTAGLLLLAAGMCTGTLAGILGADAKA